MTTSEHAMCIQERLEANEVRGALIIMMTMMLLGALVIGDLTHVGMPPTSLMQATVIGRAPEQVLPASGPALRLPHRASQPVASGQMIMGVLQVLAGSRAR